MSSPEGLVPEGQGAGRTSARSEDSRPCSVAGQARPANSLSEHWGALVATAMLGTARRQPPPPPPGILEMFVHAPWPPAEGAPPGADRAVDDGQNHDHASDLLGQVAALTAMRRAGLRPAPAPTPLTPCPPDDRPDCPPAAVRRLPELLQSWPLLVDEWLAVLESSGFRLSPEDAVTLLLRYRSDPARRARVAAAAGPLAAWLQALFPELLASRRGPARTPAGAGTAGPQGPASSASRAPRAVVTEPDQGIALPPDLAPLVELSAEALAAALVEGLEKRRWVHRHRPLLARLMCLVDPGALPVVADRLASGVVDPTNAVLAADLAHLSQTRADMLAELIIAAGSGHEQAREESPV